MADEKHRSFFKPPSSKEQARTKKLLKKQEKEREEAAARQRAKEEAVRAEEERKRKADEEYKRDLEEYNRKQAVAGVVESTRAAPIPNPLISPPLRTNQTLLPSEDIMLRIQRIIDDQMKEKAAGRKGRAKQVVSTTVGPQSAQRRR